jgi:hypothetical protein
VRSTEHRPWLEPVMATTSSVSARIGAQTSWQLQLYICAQNSTKLSAGDPGYDVALHIRHSRSVVQSNTEDNLHVHTYKV